MVESWFADWLEDHMARHRRHDWPDLDDPDPDRARAAEKFFGTWLEAFDRRGFDRAAADELSRLTAEAPLRNLNDHLPALLEAAKTMVPAKASTRPAAEKASADCPRCQGTGFAPVEHPRTGTRASGYCTCELGRWIERNHREGSPDIHARTPDLVRIDAGRSEWRLEAPNLSPSPR